MPKTFWECDGCKRHFTSGDRCHEVTQHARTPLSGMASLADTANPTQVWWLCPSCWAEVERKLRNLLPVREG